MHVRYINSHFLDYETKYQTISKKEIEKYFDCKKENTTFSIMYPGGRNQIGIQIPFVLNESVASLAGLMPDGSLIKDLRRIYFHQKKDFAKITLFNDLILNLFHPPNKIFTRLDRGTHVIYVNSTTLASFFYHLLKIPKSDEQMRVPPWVFNSPLSVKIAYLREAFAMEGTILKSLYEIRFITKDEFFANDIQKLLAQVKIISLVRERIGGTHRTLQYRVSIYGKENLLKFNSIGFSLAFHKERYNALLKKYRKK